MLPLGVHGRTIGLIEFCFSERRVFDEHDRELLSAIADQCAQALERARLYTAERRARAKAERATARTARLQSLATELAETLTSAEVAEVVVRQGIASVDADAGALQLLSNDGGFLEAVCRQGADPLLVGEAWDRFSISLGVASADAVNSREPIFIESERDIRDHYHVCSRVRTGCESGLAPTFLCCCRGGCSVSSSLGSASQGHSPRRSVGSCSRSLHNVPKRSVGPSSTRPSSKSGPGSAV